MIRLYDAMNIDHLFWYPRIVTTTRYDEVYFKFNLRAVALLGSRWSSRRLLEALREENR